MALDEVYFSREWFLGGNEPALLEQAGAAGARLYEVSKEAFAKVAYRERPDGILAVAPQWTQDACGPQAFGRALHPGRRGDRETRQPGDNPAQRGRRGLRCGDRVRSRDRPVPANVVRASTGVLFSVPCVVEESPKVLAWLKGHGVRTVATTPAAGALYSSSDLTGPIAIIMGSEQYGLSEFWLKNSDLPVRIPMAGQADSLNVAMAALITLFEAVRQRGR